MTVLCRRAPRWGMVEEKNGASFVAEEGEKRERGRKEGAEVDRRVGTVVEGRKRADGGEPGEKRRKDGRGWESQCETERGRRER